MQTEPSPAPRPGPAASRLQLPPGAWATLLDCLCDRFAQVPRATWLDRFARGRVQDTDGNALVADTPYRPGMEVRYFREVSAELAIPLAESVLYADAHLLVADKPHFLPVTPAGRFVHETLLARLIQGTGNADLVPLHRIDRATAGLVLFSVSPATRSAYQDLFRLRRIDKQYQALAPALPGLDFPLTRRTRLAAGEPFFRMREAGGEPNSETRIDVLQRDGIPGHGADIWRYALSPATGRKHQLRVHMAALGTPIVNDAFYPLLATRPADDYARPLKLLAKSLAFVDPLSGQPRQFESLLEL